jgi:hypothetical protein
MYPSKVCIATDIGVWSKIKIDTQWVWLLKRIEKVKVVTLESDSVTSNASVARWGQGSSLSIFHI